MPTRPAAWKGIAFGLGLLWLVLGASCGPSGLVKGTDADVDDRVNESLAGEARDLIFPGSATENFTFLFVSDIHLRPDESDWMGKLNAYAQNAEAAFIVCSGDNVDSGLDQEYRYFIERTGDFYAPMFSAIGNHDLYADGWNLYKKVIGPSFYSFAYGNSYFLFVDSAQATLGQDQMDEVERALKKAEQPNKFVMSHFPIYDGAAQTPAMLGSPDERYKLIYLFDKYGVDYYLSGHKHSGERYRIRNCWYIIAGAGSTYKDIVGDWPHFWRFDIDGTEIRARKIYFKDLN